MRLSSLTFSGASMLALFEFFGAKFWRETWYAKNFYDGFGFILASSAIAISIT